MMTIRATSGLTLTSIMVAVGLSGVLAVAGVRLVVNQANALRVMELIDKGDAIYRFYSNLLHDDKVWWCSLYDGAWTGSIFAATNSALHDCVLANGSCSGSGTITLKGPDCSFSPRKFRHVSRSGAELDLRNFSSSSVVFIPSGGKTLRDSLTRDDSSGWWEISLSWEHMGSRAVDLVFTQSFDADKWMSAPAAGKRYLPQLNYPRELRVRRSANYIPDGCGGAAVTSIALHTAGRNVTCSGGLASGDCRWRPASADCSSVEGGVVHNTQYSDQCSSDEGLNTSGRVSVTPTDCADDASVIARIGLDDCSADTAGTGPCDSFSYPGIAPWDNVQCALDRQGKMVTYGKCTTAVDLCRQNNPYGTWAPKGAVGQFRVTTPNSVVVSGISGAGGLICDTLMGWPAGPGRGAQGDIGPKGFPGSGPPGPPGPAWNDP